MSTTNETKIEWANWTFNPWRGCQHATLADGASHPGCEHCYAEAMAKRNPGTLGQWGEGGTRVVAAESYWRQPLKWDAAAKAEGVRKRVFCASLADVFEDWQGPMLNTAGGRLFVHGTSRKWVTIPHTYVGTAPDDGWTTMADVRRRVFQVIDATPNLDWLLLTKRPQNVRAMWPVKHDMQPIFPGCPGKLGEPAPCIVTMPHRKNVWLLTSVSNQATADALVPELLKLRDLVPVLGLSAEPLLGPVRLKGTGCAACYGNGSLYDGRYIPCPRCLGIDWVIVGSESGPHARACERPWVDSLVSQCRSTGVACFVKQFATPSDRKGGNHSLWPAAWPREFPHA